MLDRTTIPIAIALFLAALVVYLLTLAPSFVFADTAELALAAHTGGVAHPPGFPLYLLLAGLWSQLPLGVDVAWRLNVLSAVLGAACAPVIYLTVRVALSPGPQEKVAGGAAPAPRWSVEAPGVLAAAVFVFSHTFWRQATIPEVYTLNMLMASLVLLGAAVCVQRARDRRPLGRALAIWGLAGGLGLSNHITLGMMYFGVGGMVVLAPAQYRESRLRRFWLPIACGLVGLLVYLVLPMRARSEPLLNWGNPHDWPHFYRHVTGWQFQTYFRPGEEGVVAKQLGLFIRTVFLDFAVLPLALVPLGVARLLRRDRLLLAGWTIGLLVPFLWSLGYDIAEDQETYFLIPFLILSLVMGAGAAELIALGRARLAGAAGRAVLLLVLAAVALAPLAANFTRADRSEETEARAFALDVLEPVEPDALILTRYWNWYAPTMYLQHIEGIRRDVDIIDVNLLKYSWYIPYVERAHPRALAGQVGRIQAFTMLQAKWEKDDESLEPREHNELQTLFEGMIDGMVEQAWRDGRPVYATWNAAVPIERRFRKRGVTLTAAPEGLAFRLLPHARPHPLPELEFLNTWEREPLDPVARQVRRHYARLWEQRGRYYEAQGKWDLAAEAYRRADALPPGSEAAAEALRRLGGG